jgi:acetyl-CoA C-acetyltransferase
MSHAIASMVDTLRAERGTAMLFANGGYATHFHGIVLSAEPLPEATFPHDYDVNPLADAKRGAVPAADEDYEGPATIESYTVFYNRDGSVKFGTIIARTSADARVLARVDAADEAMVAFLTDGKVEPVGASGQTARGEDGLIHWRAG